MSSVLYVALGGALGASGRYFALMGVLFGYLTTRGNGSESLRLFIGVGLLGGFTTFSAFSLESIMMLERKAYGAFASYIGLSVGLSLLALIAGLWLSRGIFST